MARKTTAKDVALAAGVSASTVDRVLNGRGGVDPDKERRVVEWARKLKLDRALKHRSARTLRIAVLIQAPDNPFYAEVQNAFAAANRAYGEFNIPHPDLKIEQRVQAKDGRRSRNNCRFDAWPSWTIHAPFRRHANHEAGLLHSPDIVQKAQRLMRRPPQGMKD